MKAKLEIFFNDDEVTRSLQDLRRFYYDAELKYISLELSSGEVIMIDTFCVKTNYIFEGENHEL